MLTTTDGTSDLSRLGANAVLALSLAVGLAAAQADGLPMYRALSERFEREPLLPLPMVNILSGGAHAGGCLDFQDFLVVPVGASSFSEAIEWAAAVREATRREASSYGQLTALVADEGGLGLPMPTNRAALDLLCTGIEAAGLRVGSEVALALDVAANQFATSTGYSLLGEDRVLDAPALVEELVQWCHDYPLVSIEDPIADNDWDGWQIASSRLGGSVQLVGDDLFATDIVRLEQGIESGIANAVLVKVNQVGTLTGASDLLMRAQEAGLATVVSARSGETEDSWLADLAVGWAAGQIKVGSTTRGERTAKWNRLLQIEHALGTSVRYAGAEALRPTFRSSMTTSDQRDP
jgi:enolase